MIALDTETTVVQLKFDKIRDRFLVPDLVGASVWTGGPGRLFGWDDPELPQVLHDAFEHEIVVGHNLAFDLNVLSKAFPDLSSPIRRALDEGRLYDTTVLVHLREPTVKDKSLKTLAKVWLGIDLGGKGDVQVSFSRDRPLSEEQHQYALRDAEVTYLLAERLRSTPLGARLLGRPTHRHDISFASSHALPPGHEGFHHLDRLYSSGLLNARTRLEPVGWRLDAELCAHHLRELEEAAEDHAQRLAEAGMARRVRDTQAARRIGEASDRKRLPFRWVPGEGCFVAVQDGRVVRQAARWQLDSAAVRAALKGLAERLRLPDVPLSLKTRELSRTYSYWKDYRDEMSGELKAFMDYSKATKYLSIYFHNWGYSHTGVVYPTYYVPGTETLRWAASKPNLQQVAKRYRPCLLPPEGSVVVSADYSALEVYTLVHAMACLGIRGPLHATLASGGDMHSITAARVLGGSPETYGKGTRERQAAKALNFGVPGGLGPAKLYRYGKSSYGLDWTEAEARALRLQWLAAYPDVAAYLEVFRSRSPFALRPEGTEFHAWLAELGFDQVPSARELGERLAKGRLYDVSLPTGARVRGRTYTQAANLAFQHLGAVATTRAVNLCCAAGLRVVGCVHDSLLVLASRAEAEEVAIRLEKFMQQALAETCPEAPGQTVKAEITETFS